MKRIEPNWEENAWPLVDAKKIIGNSISFKGLNKTLKLRNKLLEFKLNDEEKISQEFLNKFKKKSFEGNLEEYYLRKTAMENSNHIHNNPHGNGFSIYMDAPYQIILVKDKKFIANAGFTPSKKSILIQQIQGVKCAEEKLKPLKWSKMLIKIITNWAEDMKIENAYLLPHKRNIWGQVGDNRTGTKKLIYDVTAKREGFKYDPKKEVYVKRLQ